MFEKMNRVFYRRNDNRLKTIDILDIATIISENVVSGGVRRSAMMVICDEDDEEVICAKQNIYRVEDGKWIEDPEISHRKMSNNSILYMHKPTLEQIRQIIHSIKINGEPGFINGREALHRKSSFRGCNPCGEILLQSKQCCNLTTNNLMAFVEENSLKKDALKEVLRLSTRVAIRMTLVEVELPEWNRVMQEDRIIGISLTGMMDMLNRTGMSYEELATLLSELREVVHREGRRYSEELGIAPPRLMTTIKPEGSLSMLPCVSSGIHYAHADYYIRRIRISTSDPLFRLIAAQGSYPYYNENGQTDEDCSVKVIEFPIKAPQGRTKYEVGAIEQLELYKLSMQHWSDHNTSITVHVREHEWEEVACWLYDNFDYVVGITFLPLMEETYPLLPYECTTAEDYERRVMLVKPIDYERLALMDDAEEKELLDKDCESGACPVR
jgi:adenosylcobalamin-dependent ribonucleoside-triphosphate reductase